MWKRIWRKFNLFIYSPEIRYKSDLIILLLNDKSRSVPFTAINFRQYAMEKIISNYFLIYSKWITGMRKSHSW